jgi:hypothetical protein
LRQAHPVSHNAIVSLRGDDEHSTCFGQSAYCQQNMDVNYSFAVDEDSNNDLHQMTDIAIRQSLFRSFFIKCLVPS